MGPVCTLNSPTGLAQSSNSNQRPVTHSYFAKRRIVLYRTSTSSVALAKCYTRSPEPVGFETEAAVRESKN